MKVCNLCERSLPFTSFHRKTATKDGYEGRCKECRSQKAKSHYLQNKDSIDARNRRYNQEHAEELARYNKRWREANPDRARERSYRWGRANPEARKVINERWKENNPESYRLKVRTQNLRRRGTPYTPAAKDYIAVIQADPCVYCGEPTTTVDHIVPISKDGSGDWDNLAPACKSCNSSKKDKDLLSFLMGRVAKGRM